MERSYHSRYPLSSILYLLGGRLGAGSKAAEHVAEGALEFVQAQQLGHDQQRAEPAAHGEANAYDPTERAAAGPPQHELALDAPRDDRHHDRGDENLDEGDPELVYMKRDRSDAVQEPDAD